jgi:hypothetical protein
VTGHGGAVDDDLVVFPEAGEQLFFSPVVRQPVDYTKV